MHFAELRQRRLQCVPDPARQILAGRIFQTGHVVEVMVVEAFVDWLERGLDVAEIHDPAGLRAGIAFDRLRHPCPRLAGLEHLERGLEVARRRLDHRPHLGVEFPRGTHLQALHRFAQAYPDISLNLSAAHTPSDFALGQADIDIRYGIPQWGDLVVEPLFEESIVPLASPEFIRQHGLKRVEQLLEVPLIQSNVSIVQWSDWFTRFTNLRAPDRFPVRFDRAQMSLDAATQGLGVALESAVNAGGHLAEGKLVAVFGMNKAIRVKAHFAVYPPRHAKRPTVEAFLFWLHSEAAKTSTG